MQVQTKINQVTVYSYHARVSRIGNVNLTAGEHTLIISSLPSEIIEESIKVMGLGKGVRIDGVDIHKDPADDYGQKALDELNDQLDTLNHELEVLADEDAIQNERVEFFSKLCDETALSGAKGLIKAKVNFGQVNEIAQQITSELNTIFEQRRKIRLRKTEIEQQIAVLKGKIDAYSPPDSIVNNSVHVLLNASQETPFEIHLSYLVENGRWEPKYEVRIINDKIQLTYNALIAQNTGEDWVDANVVLSTAEPTFNGELPEIRPIFVSEYLKQPEHRSMKLNAPMAMASMSENYSEMLQADWAKARVEKTTFTVSYRISRPITVLANNTNHKTIVTQIELPVKKDYLCVPKFADTVYMRGKVMNNSDYVLVAGDASVFHGDEYVCDTRLDDIAPKAEFDMQFGTAGQIDLKREQIERSVSKNFIGNQRHIKFAYRTKLQNHYDFPVQIMVKDQMPVSENEDIKIKLLSAEPKVTEQSDMNILTWVLDIKPHEEREIEFNYSVDHPRDMRVTGLD